ncbi:hypothetical protein UR09_01115 [Candidatus Nitromaritima sp. SCGC AAA799-A02]|nr:hypothetical protein UR09_01115 [Candidatus Nitromaritima sp. SCGC AAA799-A02]
MGQEGIIFSVPLLFFCGFIGVGLQAETKPQVIFLFPFINCNLRDLRFPSEFEPFSRFLWRIFHSCPSK